MQSFATTFCAILTDLRAAIAHIAARDRARTQFLVFLWGRISRTSQRFERLVAHWRNNTLPKPRLRARRPTRAQNPAHFRLPSRRAWLIADIPMSAAIAASQIQYLIAATPDFAQFLAAAPQAKRLLNPLWRMLDLQMPGDKPRPAPKPSFTPDPPEGRWPALPQLGVRVHPPAIATRPNFSKPS